MSIYEMIDYDELQRRIGIQPGEPWHCGGNPADDATYDEDGAVFNDLMFYAGRNPDLAGGFSLTEDINVNGLLLNHRDANNTIWLCTNIEGWWTLPPSEIPEVPKPYWDGGLLTTGRYNARTITISGCFIPPNPSLVWYNRDAILRSSAIVRGVGLLAMCGNERPGFTDETARNDPFYDPPKMAIIQTNDVPLVETVNTSGFTQFSLSFRCVNPAKLSVYERNAVLYDESDAVVRERRYRAIGLGVGEGGGDTTEYREVLTIEGSSEPRKYRDVKKVALNAPIEDEELYTSGTFDPASYITTESSKVVTLHNSGDYFAFPTFVFETITGASTSKPVTVHNLTTGESMQICRDVPSGSELVVDTNLRRVGVVNPDASAPSWRWDDRNYLTMTSQWITLAPGNNALVMSRPSTVSVPHGLPRVYWRDTWIG